MPQNWAEKVPLKESVEPVPGEKIENLVPKNQRVPMDMYPVIEQLVDKDSFFEFKKEYAKEIITGFSRIGGRSVADYCEPVESKRRCVIPSISRKSGAFYFAL